MFKKTLYNEQIVNEHPKLFSNQALKMLLIPLIIEQFLSSLMGMVDIAMVSNIGPVAISAVSLVDSINNLVIQIFLAMAAGGTIVCSRYLGTRDEKSCNEAAKQVFLTMLVISVALSTLLLIGHSTVLDITFKKVDMEVRASANIYLIITVLSYPFLALFNAGSAFYRAQGNSKFPMKISVISNGINIVGNFLLIFVFKWGVLGAALATLLSRIFCTVVIYYFLHKENQIICIRNYLKIRPNFKYISSILSLSIPAGIENGMFQFGKLAIQSTVSELGVIAMSAHAMTSTMEMVNGIAGIGVGIGLMTVVGQCIGAGRIEEAKYYIVKLTIYAEITIIIACLLVQLLIVPVTYIASMEPESARLCIRMVTFITCIKPIVWVLSFIPAYGMRAAGDVKFTMIVSTLSMWVCRVALTIYLCKGLGMGPISVWIGMGADWLVRSIIFALRFLSGKWYT